MSYFSLNKLGESRRLLLEALPIREKLLPEDDEDLGVIWGNLGIVEWGEGNLDRALECYAKADRTQRMPEAETAVATALNNKARVHVLQKQYDIAAQEYAQAKLIYEKNFGFDSFPMQG